MSHNIISIKTVTSAVEYCYFSCFSVVMVTILRPKMASLLGGQLFQISGQGPPPPKDFFQLVITKNEVEYLYDFLFIK